MPPPPLNAGQVAAIIQQISSATGAEVVFKSMCFEVHGLEQEVRAAVSMILDLDIVKVWLHYSSPYLLRVSDVFPRVLGIPSRDSFPD
jgi:hypothetical protein